MILLLSKLREEEDAIRIKAIIYELHHEFKRLKKYVVMEENVLRFLFNFEIGPNDVNLLIELAKLLFY
jgi:hypothetical protein